MMMNERMDGLMCRYIRGVRTLGKKEILRISTCHIFYSRVAKKRVFVICSLNYVITFCSNWPRNLISDPIPTFSGTWNLMESSKILHDHQGCQNFTAVLTKKGFCHIFP